MVKSKVKDLCRLLSKSLGEDVEVLDQTTSLLTAPGEHYGSIMLAIDVKYKKTDDNKESSLNLVAKLIPANAMLRIAFDIPVTFKKEVFAYTETIPTLTRLQQQYGIVDPNDLYENLFPKCYGARLCLDENQNQVVDEDGVLLFENLKLLGYRTEDRLKGFDLDATRLIIRDLAKFHAIPIALDLLERQQFEEKVMPALVKNKGLEQLPPEVGQAFHNSILETAVEIPELEPYLVTLQLICNDAVENPYVNRPPPNEPWGTMTHSDYWVSNTMLLRDNQNRPISNKIVDLQIMRYASCVRDLIFFLFTSVMNTVLDQHLDEFLKLYYDEFIANLQQFDLDLEQFSWKGYLAEISEVAPTEVYHILVMLKPIFTERGKVQNSLEDFQDSDWSRKDLLGPHHRRKLKDTVLALVRNNWL